MYYTIIPGLVSIETELKTLNGFHLSEQFDFYPKTLKKNRFHYTLVADETIAIPKKYDIRSGYFLKKDTCWYYDRHIKIFNITFRFDTQTNTFSFNKLYSHIPVEIGNIFPVGRHVANLIGLKLFLSNIIIIRACAFSKKDTVHFLIAPGLNGKTSIVDAVVKSGGNYIAEDLVAFDFTQNYIYPTSPKKNFGREINNKLLELLHKKRVVDLRQKISTVTMYQKTKTNNESKKSFLDYLFMNSLFFLSNPFIRAFIAECSYSEKILTQMRKIATVDIQAHMVNDDMFVL